MAYIIGVFLGDGSINQGRTFTLQSIDYDFNEKTLKCLKDLSKNNSRLIELNRLTTANNIVYKTDVSDVALCNTLKELTNNRSNLPIDFSEWDRELQLELISGLLDSEGYVSMSKIHIYNNQKVFDMRIGIGACDVWLYELYDFCKTNGIQVGKITREKLKSNKIFSRFIFNKKSFIESGLFFNIFRKQQRIENYKILFLGSTTNRGISKTNYTRKKMLEFAKSRQRVGGRFVKLDKDIV